MDPGLGEKYFKFWVAPVTMVFENVHQVIINIDSQQGIIEISDLHREAPTPTPNGERLARTALTQKLSMLNCP